MSARVIIHSLAQARAALTVAAALGRDVTLASAPSAGGYAGPGWFKALTDEARRAVPAARCEVVLDCGAAPGVALAALRLGLKRVRFTGAAEAARRLAALGATLESGDEPALDLRGSRRPETRCRAWLAGDAVTRA